MKSIYVLQPYHVGSRNGKSLAMVIPAEVAKACNIDISTAFALRVDRSRKHITLESINEINERKEDKSEIIPAGESFQTTSSQPVPSVETQ
jgi:antitoxin component of MazEF toxin-antitoxin module